MRLRKKKAGASSAICRYTESSVLVLRIVRCCLNGLFSRRKEIEGNWRSCLDAITDTSEFEAELDKATAACDELQTLMKNALLESGRHADAGDATRRYEEYQSRLMEKAAVVTELEEKIAALNAKRIRAERYLKALSDRNGPMTQFEPLA